MGSAKRKRFCNILFPVKLPVRYVFVKLIASQSKPNYKPLSQTALYFSYFSLNKDFKKDKPFLKYQLVSYGF